MHFFFQSQATLSLSSLSAPLSICFFFLIFKMFSDIFIICCIVLMTDILWLNYVYFLFCVFFINNSIPRLWFYDSLINYTINRALLAGNNLWFCGILWNYLWPQFLWRLTDWHSISPASVWANKCFDMFFLRVIR